MVAESVQRRDRLIAWIIWVGFTLGLLWVANRQIIQQQTNTVVPVYTDAARHWIHGESLYDLEGVHGFLYLPSAAVLMVPLTLLPAAAQEIGWRVLCMALLAYATLRLARILKPHVGRDPFFWMTLLVVPISLGSLRAGQMNLVLAATWALATADLIEKRYGRVAFWLALGLALKPQAIVFALVIGALSAPMRWRAAIAIVAAFAIPFLSQRPDYAIEQYRLCLHKLAVSGQPGEAGVRNSDLFGLLGALGIWIPEWAHWIIRLAAAPLAVGLAWLVTRRGDRLAGPIAMLAASVCYLMLLNPRTEGGSYIIAAIPLVVYLCWAIGKERRAADAILLITIGAGWTLSYEISRWLWVLANKLQMTSSASYAESIAAPFWLSPLLCITFIATIIWIIRTGRGPRENVAEAPFTDAMPAGSPHLVATHQG